MDREAFALKMKRTTDADDAGAYHGDRLGHQFGENDTVGARTLPKVKMPNRDGFVTFARGN